jgi:gamma-glutamyltranspeptidase/glutathione hydrolase
MQLINPDRNDPDIRPGDPYPFQGGTNPFRKYLDAWHTKMPAAATDATSAGSSGSAGSTGARTSTGMAGSDGRVQAESKEDFMRGFLAGTTSIQAADAEGWVVSVTPSGGWIPAVIAGSTGVGMSQRMQSFVLDAAENPFNVLEPGKRPRATLTPSLALKDGKPFLSFAVQGGDTQDQNLLQFFLNVVEFDMNVQQAAEAANITSYQMRSSFGDHSARAGRVTLHDQMPSWIRDDLRRMGYRPEFSSHTSGPINAIWFDWKHGTFWGGSSTDGEDYGIAW